MKLVEPARVVLDSRAVLGEGVNWDTERGVLYWVDILNGEVHVLDPATGKDRCIQVGHYVGAVVPTRRGDLMLALHHGFARLDIASERLRPVADPEAHLPGNRFNDGKCDPAGRFWAGTMQLDGEGTTGALYRMDADLSVRRMVDNVGISNGLAWDVARETMYFIDTLKREVAAFEYDPVTGDIANRRAVVRFDAAMGHPDGMTIDAEGMLWVAMCGGGRVTRWNPETGRQIGEVALPVTMVTNCVFGGPDLGTLYVSTASVTLDEGELAAQPHAGALFGCRPGVMGVAAPPFAG